MIGLSGQATGTYSSTETNRVAGTLYQIKGSGTITPIGSAAVSGAYHALGSDSALETGTLMLVGPHGKLNLKLTASISPIAANRASQPGSGINPGGPMIPASTQSIASGPIILVYSFDYRIVRGTGQYARDRGTGVVQITSTPGLSSPTGPGIYAAVSASSTSPGRITLNFSPGPEPI